MFRGLSVLPAHRDRRVSKAQPVLKVPPELRVLKVIKVSKVQPAHKVHKVHKEVKEHKVIQV